jgi:ubiquinone/menaquinone biosynthesis C-methylase UbiE
MDEDEFARALLAHERRDWQDPEKILDQIGIAPGDSVADLGCGPGFFSIPIAKRIQPGGIVYAVDSSRRMLDYLKSNVKKSKVNPKSVKIIHSEASKTGIPERAVDVVLIANVLHDIEDKSEFLNEVKRISKSGSKIADVDWVASETEIGPPVEIRLDEKAAKSLLERAGFGVARKIKAGPYHYGFVCRMK